MWHIWILFFVEVAASALAVRIWRRDIQALSKATIMVAAIVMVQVLFPVASSASEVASGLVFLRILDIDIRSLRYHRTELLALAMAILFPTIVLCNGVVIKVSRYVTGNERTRSA